MKVPCVCNVIFQNLPYNLKCYMLVREKCFLHIFSDHDQKHFLIFGSHIRTSEFNASFYMVGIYISAPLIGTICTVFVMVENIFFFTLYWSCVVGWLNFCINVWKLKSLSYPPSPGGNMRVEEEGQSGSAAKFEWGCCLWAFAFSLVVLQVLLAWQSSELGYWLCCFFRC